MRLLDGVAEATEEHAVVHFLDRAAETKAVPLRATRRAIPSWCRVLLLTFRTGKPSRQRGTKLPTSCMQRQGPHPCYRPHSCERWRRQQSRGGAQVVCLLVGRWRRCKGTLLFISCERHQSLCTCPLWQHGTHYCLSPLKMGQLRRKVLLWLKL